MWSFKHISLYKSNGLTEFIEKSITNSKMIYTVNSVQKDQKSL